jgi:hypothetical protein
MALPLKPGLTPAEVAFLCEMEMVTVIPRQRLDSLELLGVTSSPVQTSATSIDSQDRALPKPLCLRSPRRFLYGSPCYSNANVARTSCLHPGSTPKLFPQSSTLRSTTKTSSPHHLRSLHPPLFLQTFISIVLPWNSRRLSYPRAPPTPHQMPYPTTGWN